MGGPGEHRALPPAGLERSGQGGREALPAAGLAVVTRAAGRLPSAAQRLSEAADRLSLGVAAALAALVAAAMVLQVWFRFVLRSPLSWSEEFARYCFVWLSSLGAAAGVRRGLHPGLDLGLGRLRGPARELVSLGALLLGAIFMAVVLVYGWELARFNMRQRSPAMGLPMGLPYAAVPTGAGLMLIHTLALALTGAWRHRPPK